MEYMEVNYEIRHNRSGRRLAGCAIATRLSEEPDRSVLLLEAGPDYPDFENLPDDLKQGKTSGCRPMAPTTGLHRPNHAGADRTDHPPGQGPRRSSAVNGQVMFRGIPEDYDGGPNGVTTSGASPKCCPTSTSWKRT